MYLWVCKNMTQGTYDQMISLAVQFTSVSTAVIWNIPDSKVHGTNMGPTWVLPAPDGPRVGPWTLLSGIWPIHSKW